MSLKQKKPGPGFGGSGDEEGTQDQEQYSPEGANKVLGAIDTAFEKCWLTYGAHDLYVEIAGMSVAEVQLVFKDIITVDDDAEAYINGKLVPNKSVRLVKGDRLQFMKEAGQKGQDVNLERLRKELLRKIPGLSRAVNEDIEEDEGVVKTTTKDVTVKREDVKQIVIPFGMQLKEAAAWLMRKDQEEDKEVEVYHEIDCFPLDGCVAFRDALVDTYGYVQNVDTPMFGGKQPPVMIGVPISATEVRQVPWGRVEIPNIDGFLATGLKVSKAGLRFLITGKTRQRHLYEINDIVDRVKKRLTTHSIYKGNAIRVDLSWTRNSDPARIFDPTGHAPKFSIPLTLIKEDELIFSAAVERDIQLGLFTPIENAEACRIAGIPLKRGVLLAGDYGTGKTLTAYATAIKCRRNGFTFIYLASVKDLAMAFQLAKQYAPAVIFSEDVDRVLGSQDRTEEIDAVLNAFDGVDSKEHDIITVLTTNHLANLTKAVLRPGRCDTLVLLTRPDEEAASRLVKLYGRGLFNSNTNFEIIGKALANHLPAEIREAVERAKLAAITRISKTGEITGGISGRVMEKDVVAAVEAMRLQHEMLQPQQVDSTSPLEKAAKALGFELRNGLADRDETNAEAALRLLQRFGVKARHLNEATEYLDEANDEEVHHIPVATDG